MKRKTVAAVCSVLVLGAVVGFGLPAPALDQSDKTLEVSLDKPVSEHDYPALAVSDTLGFTLYPEDCKTFPTCDYIPVVLDVPEGTLFKLTIITSFEHAQGSNDIDVFFWEGTFPVDETGERAETPEWVDIGSSATGGEPEKMNLGDIDPSSDLLLYSLTPINFSGAPLSYHVKAELTVQELPDVGQYEYTPPTGSKSFARDPATGSLRFGDLGDTSRGQPAAAGDLPDPVKVPGADGELTEHDLLAVKGQATEEEPSRAPLVAAVVAVLALGAGTFLWFFIRSRRSVEEPT